MFGAPVVVKILDPRVAHKAELGAVHVAIDTIAALDGALDAIDAASGPTSRLPRGSGDRRRHRALVGGVRDSVWGPVIAFGSGGHGVEAHKPSSRLAPLSDLDLAELVAEVQPTMDPDVVAPVIRAVEALLLAHPQITEIDVNPVRLTSQGAIALDALVVCVGRQER